MVMSRDDTRCLFSSSPLFFPLFRFAFGFFSFGHFLGRRMALASRVNGWGQRDRRVYMVLTPSVRVMVFWFGRMVVREDADMGEAGMYTVIGGGDEEVNRRGVDFARRWMRCYRVYTMYDGIVPTCT
ncbi:uncharacterized protein EI97DRAFT_252238 [Westerdykella ornata]|uniref:Uncharacterized protein n=1 Tax=Westerdykella ornata TaxID=318751 RepID=A0A6A6JTS0_WESOR|nr:uncharacterized protein EI97DRAFT_252238 [Westerdykella ornata]KAF2278399.1 hypothetical protein EI97DRAFT_252238 [Westerdykella ornata]